MKSENEWQDYEIYEIYYPYLHVSGKVSKFNGAFSCHTRFLIDIWYSKNRKVMKQWNSWISLFVFFRQSDKIQWFPVVRCLRRWRGKMDGRRQSLQKGVHRARILLRWATFVNSRYCHQPKGTHLEISFS